MIITGTYINGKDVHLTYSTGLFQCYPNIINSRLESWTYNPSLDFLSELGCYLGKEVQITFNNNARKP